MIILKLLFEEGDKLFYLYFIQADNGIAKCLKKTKYGRCQITEFN